MKPTTLSWKKLTFLIGFLLTFNCHADLVVIVHPDNPATVDSKSIKRIFLGKEKRFSDGGKITPVNQVNGSPTRQEFDTNILGRSSSQVKAYWSKLIFTGKGTPPEELSNDAAVISKVAADVTAIGYVDDSTDTSTVKIISLN